ncbi:MAG: hypothetical protein GYA24_03645 [Candidatus Lokiarchaeota archaeon]|nr:hypothetical protein [Candidatus Lokiarchaeota archaeon]
MREERGEITLGHDSEDRFDVDLLSYPGWIHRRVTRGVDVEKHVVQDEPGDEQVGDGIRRGGSSPGHAFVSINRDPQDRAE